MMVMVLKDGEVVEASPPEILIGAAAADKLKQIEAEFEQDILSIESEYSAKERESWGQQESEAVAWSADHLAATPLLDGIAAQRTDIDKAELAEKVLTNAKAWKALYGAALGRKHERERKLALIDLEQAGAIELIRSI